MLEKQATSEQIMLEVPSTLKELIEAMIFAAQEPLSIAQIKAIYQDGRRVPETQQLDPETIKKIVSDLNKEYEQSHRPYRIVQIAGGYQFATLTVYAAWIGKLYKEQGRRKLSQSGVETLCIIAYKQPITKSEIEKIRGVNCDYILKTLLEKELITVTGRAETVGRPLLYGTTKEFLKHFGLNEIVDLPRPREIEEILGESQFETERRMLEAQAGAEQMKKEQEDFKSRLPHIPKKKPDLGQQGVEIVSRNTAKDIRIVSRQDRIPSEQQFDEIAESADDALPDLDQSKQADAPTESVRPVNESRGPAHPESAGAAGNIAQSEGTGRALEEDRSGIDRQFLAARAPSEPIKTREPEPPVMGGTQSQSRWRLWREKIRDFIKNLFV